MLIMRLIVELSSTHAQIDVLSGSYTSMHSSMNTHTRTHTHTHTHIHTHTHTHTHIHVKMYTLTLLMHWHNCQNKPATDHFDQVKSASWRVWTAKKVVAASFWVARSTAKHNDYTHTQTQTHTHEHPNHKHAIHMLVETCTRDPNSHVLLTISTAS